MIVQVLQKAKSPRRQDNPATLDPYLLIVSVQPQALHCLEGQEIKAVGDLVGYTPAELLAVRNFGRTSLSEVKSKLGELGLSLGMEPVAEEASTS